MLPQVSLIRAKEKTYVVAKPNNGLRHFFATWVAVIPDASAVGRLKNKSHGAPVDLDVLRGHPAGRVAGQERDHRSDLRGLA